jgi:hypothetical protein
MYTSPPDRNTTWVNLPVRLQGGMSRGYIFVGTTGYTDMISLDAITVVLKIDWNIKIWLHLEDQWISMVWVWIW